jgi:competence protein ComEA
MFLGVLLGREASMTEDLPVFSHEERNFMHIELSGGGLTSGVYQFNDGLTPRDVIKLTEAWGTENFSTDPAWARPLCDGESLRIVKKDREIELLHRGWMAASRRMAMGIPLHPDRMSCADWTALPGIGPDLAKRIEIDRQKNGDFGRLDALSRVPGIGEKRLDRWRPLF